MDETVLNAHVPELTDLPRHVRSLADYDHLAGQRLDAAAWAYICHGMADDITLRRNRQAWDALTLWPRVLGQRLDANQDPRGVPMLLGKPFPNPVMLAPVAYQRIAHPDGEVASACAASAQGVGYVMSTLASMPLEQVAHAIGSDEGRGPLWFQLYWQGCRDTTLALATRAHAAGFEALVLTVDVPVKPSAGYQLPAGVHAVNSLPQARHAVPPGWDDVQWLVEQVRQHLRLPFLLKGVLHPDDARQAQGMGIDALVVSNHGGRALDTVPAAIDVLPAVRQAVGADMPLLVDGGVRRGTDVFKALALGAQGVMLGRPIMSGLAVAGAAGVAHMLRLLLDEFDMTLQLCGCAAVRDIGPQYLWQPHD